MGFIRQVKQEQTDHNCIKLGMCAEKVVPWIQMI